MRPPVLKTRQFLGIGKISAPIFEEVNFSKDDRVKIEVPDPLAVEDLISYIQVEWQTTIGKADYTV